MGNGEDETPPDSKWRLPLGDQINAVVARVDWVSQVGARATRLLAIVAWAGAVACWMTIFRTWGSASVVLSVVALVPGFVLWSYAKSVDAAVDATRIEAGIVAAFDDAGAKIADVGAAMQEQRFRIVRAAFRLLRAVRGIRDDINNLGIDIVNWARISNPLYVGAAAVAAALAALMVLAALVAGALRLIF